MRTPRLFVAVAGAGLAGPVLAGCTGVPDTKFGSGGLMVLPDQITAPQLVSLPNGRTMVASYDIGDQGGMVVRLNANGSVDRSYGRSGQLSVHLASQGFMGGKQEALGPDGRAYFVDEHNRLTAYTAAGRQDTTFGSVQLPVVRGQFAGQPVIAANGDIYVSPSCETTGCNVWRYTRTGRRDASFVYRGTGPGASVAAVGGDRRVYVSTRTAGGFVYTLLKLTPTGAVDTAFGQGGRLTLPRSVTLNSVYVGKDNRVTLGVTIYDSNSHPVPFVLRYTARGTADLTFGWRGIAGMPGSAGTPDFSGGSYGGPVTVDRLGRTVAAPWAASLPAPLLVYRYTTRGGLDRTFGINGVAFVNADNFVPEIGAVTTDTANRILVGTATSPDYNGDWTSAVLRLTG